jgi:hypothetical protein
MDYSEYKRATAECIMLAASKGMCEPDYLFRPGRAREDLTQLQPALRLVERLILGPPEDRRAWFAVSEMLSPEINLVVTHLRYMQSARDYLRLGDERLAVLEARVREFGAAEEPVPESGTHTSYGLPGPSRAQPARSARAADLVSDAGPSMAAR